MKRIFALIMLFMMTFVSGCVLFEKKYNEKEFEKIYLDAAKKTSESKKWMVHLEYIAECGKKEVFQGYSEDKEGNKMAFLQSACNDEEASFSSYYKSANDTKWTVFNSIKKDGKIIKDLPNGVEEDSKMVVGFDLANIIDDYFEVDLSKFEPEAVEDIGEAGIEDIFENVNFKANTGIVEESYHRTNLNTYKWTSSLEVNVSEVGKNDYKTAIDREINIKDDKIKSIKMYRGDIHYSYEEIKTIKIKYSFDMNNYYEMF